MVRRHVASHENHERWLVSYADFITLLFAFFVVMFASTQSDRERARAVSDSVRDALEHGQFSNVLSTVLGRGRHEASRPPLNAERVALSDNPPPLQAPADLHASLEALRRALPDELAASKVGLRLEDRGLIVSLRESGFFASGDDRVDPEGYPILASIATVIQGLPNPIRLEGHTDAVPIHNSRFRSNWELSAARAIAMMQLFSERYGIAVSRLAIAGYAENAPADTNDTVEGRAHNRRVDLVVLSAEAVKSEPAAVSRPR